MNMKSMAECLFFVGATVFTVHAATFTWDGGSAVDSNWSTSENWNPDGSVPVSASDTLIQLNGGARLTPSQNIATPFTLNRLEFLGGSSFTTAFNLGGNQLQFVANVATQPYIYLNRNATCVVNNPIDIPADTILTLHIGTYGVELRGAITGAGGIEKLEHAGGINLYSSANTFSGGLTIRAQDSDWFKANIYASNAMGTGPVSLYGGTLATNKPNPGGLAFYNTTSHTNLISLFKNSPIFAYGTVTLDGPLDLNTYTLFLRGNGSGTISGAISEGGANAVIKLDTGTWTFSGANTFAGHVIVSNGTFRIGAAGTLGAAVPLTVAGGTFDLNGISQTVSLLRDNGVSGTRTVTSATAATLTVNQDVDTRFDGQLAGALRLVKAGTGALTLSNSLSATTGDIIISNGTLVAASASCLGNSANVSVAGGVLELRNSAAVSDAAAMRIESGAKLRLAAGIAETVDKLFIDGVQQPRGIYGTTESGAEYADDAHFEGAGLLYVNSNPAVTPAAAVWDAEGNDTLMATPENWEGDTTPAFDGSTRAIFATAGTTATVGANVRLYGMTFNRDGAFTLADGDGKVTLGAGGIIAEVPTTTSRAYTLAANLLLDDHQIWSVTNNGTGTTTLNVTGRIDDGALPSNITKTDFGVLTLAASNTFDGTLTANHGILRVTHPHALGSTNGSTTIQGVTGALIYLNGGFDLAEPLVLNGERNNAGTLRNESGSNTLSGPVTCYVQTRWVIQGTALVVSGGVTQPDNSGGLFVINASAPIYFRTKPLNLPTKTFYTDSGGLTVLQVAGNTWTDTMVASGTLRCDVPDALPPTASLRLGIGYGPNGTLNLNGNDQTCSRLYAGTTNAGTRTVTSPVPATLTVNQSANSAFDGRFTGAVNLLKLGAGNLTLTNATTTTTGSITVNEGTLTVANAYTFDDNTTSIVVGGTGTLALETSSGISDNAVVSMPAAGVDTAKISLAAGVNETVGWLLYGEKVQRVGTYGSTASSAQHKDDTRFSGTGVLTVRRDDSGTVIMLK